MKYKSTLLILTLLFVTSCAKNEVSDREQINYFKVNEKILIIAPAGGVKKNEITRLKQKLPQNIIIKDNIVVLHDSPYHSKDDNKRYDELYDAITNGEYSIIWCLRGGYGSAKLIERLDKLPPPKKEKKFIGYSDITALHLFMSQKWGWKTIHGSMIFEIGKKNPQNFSKIIKILEKKESVQKIDLNLVSHERWKESIEGKLTGGNIYVIQTGIGTKWQINTKNKILFLEGGGEDFRVDRMLEHLLQAKILEGVKAIIFGEFIGTKDIKKVIKCFSKRIKVPMFTTNKFGHDYNNYPLSYNLESKIIYDGKKSKHDLLVRFN